MSTPETEDQHQHRSRSSSDARTRWSPVQGPGRRQLPRGTHLAPICDAVSPAYRGAPAGVASRHGRQQTRSTSQRRARAQDPAARHVPRRWGGEEGCAGGERGIAKRAGATEDKAAAKPWDEGPGGGTNGCRRAGSATFRLSQWEGLGRGTLRYAMLGVGREMEDVDLYVGGSLSTCPPLPAYPFGRRRKTKVEDEI